MIEPPRETIPVRRSAVRWMNGSRAPERGPSHVGLPDVGKFREVRTRKRQGPHPRGAMLIGVKPAHGLGATVRSKRCSAVSDRQHDE